MSETPPRETLPPELADVFLRLDAYRDAVIALEDDESPQDRWDELEREVVAARAALESSLGAMVRDATAIARHAATIAIDAVDDMDCICAEASEEICWYHLTREQRITSIALRILSSPHAAPSGETRA